MSQESMKYLEKARAVAYNFACYHCTSEETEAQAVDIAKALEAEANRPKVSTSQTGKSSFRDRLCQSFEGHSLFGGKAKEKFVVEVLLPIIEDERNQRVSVSREAVREILFKFKEIYRSDAYCGCDHCKNKLNSTLYLMDKNFDEATDAIMKLLEGV